MAPTPLTARTWLTRLGAGVICASLLAAETAGAVRPVSDISPYIDQSPVLAKANFGKGGVARIAGGVVFQGRAQFILERAGRQPLSLEARSVRLDLGTLGQVVVVHAGVAYDLETHPGIACPLGRFFQSDRVIAYTVPPDLPEDEREAAERALLEAGIEDRVAEEFVDTSFVPLLEKTDFAATEALPSDIEQRLKDDVNQAVGSDESSGSVDDEDIYEDLPGSYLNSDYQITYKVFLMATERRADIAGVPLRYYWESTPSGTSAVHKITVMSQDFGEQSAVLEQPDDEQIYGGYSQYDAVVLYQTAALFRQMRATDAASFGRFVDKACAAAPAG